MKSILLVIHDPSHAGIFRYCLSLYRELKKISENPIDAWLTFPSKVQITKSYGSKLFPFINLGNSLLTFFELLSGRRFHNVYSLYHLTNVTITPALLVSCQPAIVTIHDVIPFSLESERSRSWLGAGSLLVKLAQKSFSMLTKAYKIICVSKSTKYDLQHYLHVNDQFIEVIYYGVDHELFKPRDKLEARRKLGLPLDRPIILNVGSEESRKNIPTLLRSLKELLNSVPNALLVRVGERDAHTEKLINSLGLNGKVLYRRASPNEVALYYNAADLLCFPSYYEGFGNPPLEAMASGLPVIAGNRTSIPEVVSHAGILLDPFDVEGFAYWMREVLMNEDLRNKLSEAGYKRSMDFSWEKCARETLEVYNEVLNEV